MGLGSMLGDVLKSFFSKPVTVQYPFVRTPTPITLRGKLIWEPEKCTSCQLCVRDCPANALEFFVIDKATKKFVMKYYNDRCIYCKQCVQSCRFDCLELSSEEWEMAALNRQPFTVYYGKPEDVQTLLANLARKEHDEIKD